MVAQKDIMLNHGGYISYKSDYYYYIYTGQIPRYFQEEERIDGDPNEIKSILEKFGLEIIQEQIISKPDESGDDSVFDPYNRILTGKTLYRSPNLNFFLTVIYFNDQTLFNSAFDEGGKLYNDKISNTLRTYKENLAKKQKFGLISCDSNYFSITLHKMDQIKVNLDLNYGEEFKKTHDLIVYKINSKTNGLYIFRGEPGSGKSSYIRYLSGLSNRTFVYIPTSLVNSLSQPSFSDMLIRNKNIVLVVEDAEKAVISRENKTGNEDLVSAILNLSDGILGSLLKISIIITFNTSKESIDDALIRKGRLIMDYEFKKLSIEESQKLSDSLGYKKKISEPMVLSDIYNIEDPSFKNNPTPAAYFQKHS